MIDDARDRGGGEAVSPIDPGNVPGDLSFAGPISKDGAR